MLNYLLVTFIVIVMTLSSYAYGSLIQDFFQWKITKYINVLLGFNIIVGILNIVIYPIINYKVSSDIFLTLLLLIICLPIFFYKKIKWVKLDSIMLVFGLILFIRILITYNRGIAEESFDTVHYLSYIIEASKGSFLTEFDVNGVVRTWVLPQDDFSSHYYILSSIYRLVEFIKTQLSFDILTLTMPVVIWITTIFYYILSISVTFVSIEVLNVKNKVHQFIIILLTQFFIGSFYYNSVFQFYGNTYRTLFAGVLVLLIYLATQKKKFNFSYSIMIMLTTSAILGFSGSGYLISFISIYSYVVLILRNKNLSNRNLALMYILFIPVILFVINFWVLGGIVSVSKIILLTLLYITLMLVTIVFKLPLQIVYKTFFYVVFPIGILLYSLKINQVVPLMQDFFIQRSYTDMVWNYLSISNLREILFNSLLWISLILYSIKSKDMFSKYFIVILVIFINPIMYPFIVKVLSYDLVYQRNYDALFNTFTFILLFAYFFQYFARNRVIQVGVLIVSIFLAQYSTFNNYHIFFQPEENYNGFSRLPQDQVEAFEVLNTKVHLEGYDRAVVLSQVPSIKGFVSNIYSVLDYNTFRSIDRFDNNATPPYSPLWNIFMPRDYIGQKIFIDEPDYENTCKYLIEAQVDFVLVDAKQFYMKDGNFIPLYLKVRDCAKEVYSNDRYILYQFYW